MSGVERRLLLPQDSATFSVQPSAHTYFSTSWGHSVLNIGMKTRQASN